MTTTDVTQILAALATLTERVNGALEQLARIEERTSVLTDHETRIRAAEEAARVAGEVAVAARATAEAQAVRIRTLEDTQNSTGKFTLGVVGRFAVGLGGLLIVGVTITNTIHGWS